MDATIEMVDGVMVVSPKEVKFEPKDGDVVSVDDGNYIDVSYFIKSVMVNGWICEKYIFLTKEELLKSL